MNKIEKIKLFLLLSIFGGISINDNINLSTLSILVLLFCIDFNSLKYSQSTTFVLIMFVFFIELLSREYVLYVSDISMIISILKIALVIAVVDNFNGTKQDYIQIIYSSGLLTILSEVVTLFFPALKENYYIDDSLGKNLGISNNFTLLRPTGLVGDPNYFAFPIAILTVALFFEKKYVASLLCLIILVLSGSRSAILSILIAISIGSLKFNRGLIKKIIISIMVFVSMFSLNILIRGGEANDSNIERIVNLINGIESILNFSFLNSNYGYPIGFALDGSKMVVHNFYIQTLATSFILGIFFIIRTLNAFNCNLKNPILICVITELFFLDISSHFFLIFLFLMITSNGFKQSQLFTGKN